ncbi:MAG: SH3 domain-containing protein [Eubacteriales bacterium]|nr:SH3 domain-containing protein [Eubacteriales bacterium]
MKASSLRVVASPGGDELVGTVTRGDRVTQLATPKDGWILIKMTDGRLGYVPESLLLFPDEGE